MVWQLPDEIEANMTSAEPDSTIRRYSDVSASAPAPSSINVMSIGTPLIPPSALILSTMISAASRAGTPKTDAGPVKKAVIPMFRLSGLSAAIAITGKAPATIAATVRFTKLFVMCLTSLGSDPSADRDWIDDHLHRPFDAGLAQHGRHTPDRCTGISIAVILC